MAGIKITDLPAAPSALLTDVYPVDQLPGPVTYKESNAQLLSLFQDNMVSTITGTANQVIASASIGDVVLSLPQDIAPGSNVQFNTVKLSPAGILDSNGNTVLGLLNLVPGAVNYINVTNSATGQPVDISAVGTDGDISFSVFTKGLGVFTVVSRNLTQPFSIWSGTGALHITNFNFANTAVTRNVTFQDSSGTLAFTNDQWTDQTTNSVTMTVNTGYTSDAGASLITFTLPSTSAIGDFVEINGKGAGGWIIAQAAGQQIHVGNLASTLGAVGSVASTNQFDCVRLRCLTANTIWTVASQQSAGLTIV